MSVENLRRMAVNARIGDGHIGKCASAVNYKLMFMSTSLDYLQWKHEMCRNADPGRLGQTKSGYGGKKFIGNFATKVHSEVTEVAEMPFAELIKSLDKQDLILLYLDDGSYHRGHGTVHIYCNSFSVEETELLADRIFEVYGIQRPTLRWDKKRDGRKFPYLYLTRLLAEQLMSDTLKFLDDNGIVSLRYKAEIKHTLNGHRKGVKAGPFTQLSRVGSNPEAGGEVV